MATDNPKSAKLKKDLEIVKSNIYLTNVIKNVEIYIRKSLIILILMMMQAKMIF